MSTEDKHPILNEEVALGESIDVHELVTQTEFKPNRAARRADIKRNRALQKRNPRV